MMNKDDREQIAALVAKIKELEDSIAKLEPKPAAAPKG